MDSICFSIINGDKDVIVFSSLLGITKIFAKFSFALNVNVPVAFRPPKSRTLGIVFERPW